MLTDAVPGNKAVPGEYGERVCTEAPNILGRQNRPVRGGQCFTVPSHFEWVEIEKLFN